MTVIVSSSCVKTVFKFSVDLAQCTAWLTVVQSASHWSDPALKQQMGHRQTDTKFLVTHSPLNIGSVIFGNSLSPECLGSVIFGNSLSPERRVSDLLDGASTISGWEFRLLWQGCHDGFTRIIVRPTSTLAMFSTRSFTL